MAHSLLVLRSSLSHSFPSSSRTPALPRQCIRIWTLARRDMAYAARAMQSPGVDGAEQSKGEPKGPSSDDGPNKPSGSGLPLPCIPVWARWLLGTLVCLAVPLYRRVVRIEDKVDKGVETAAEIVEKVAEATEKIAGDMADALPTDGKLKEEAMKIEHIAELVDKGAKEAEAFIRKVDKVTEEVDTLVEPIIKEGELLEKEIQEQKEADQPKA